MRFQFPQPAKAVKNDRWIVGNEEDSTNIWTLSQFCPSFLFDFADFSHTSPVYHFIEFKQSRIRWIVPERYTRALSRDLLKKVLLHPSSFLLLQTKLVNLCDELYDFSRRLGRYNLKRLSNAALGKIFAGHLQLASKVYGCGLVSTMTEFPEAVFTSYIQDFLVQRVQELKLAVAPVEYFGTLSSILAESIQYKEQKDLLALGGGLRANNKIWQALKRGPKGGLQVIRESPRWYNLIIKHSLRYSWAYYGYIGPVLTPQRVIKDLSILAKSDVNPQFELRKLSRIRQKVTRDIKRLQRELKFNNYERKLLLAYRSTLFMKLYRKDAMTFSLYAMEPFVRELALRAGITYKEAQNLIPGEHQLILKGNINIKNNLRQRSKYCIYSAISKELVFLVGKPARAFLRKMYKEVKLGKIHELKGQTACIGRAEGLVRIINNVRDIKKMKVGNILISVSTTPDIVSAMKKAAAIVTEVGGITSHAAIVSRELNIPCIIGTKVATKVFKNGDLVEVDATKGIVRKVG